METPPVSSYGLDPGGSGTAKLSMIILRQDFEEAEKVSADGGVGGRLGRAAIIVAGVASLVATLLAVFSIWSQLKNYRKPLLQRYVVRILLMVPIYAVSSWVSLISMKAASFVDPIREIYEAFTIYTFFQLLINFLGGERSLIIMMHGRPPIEHVWPMNLIFPKVDISDPHTFLAIKRGILQYAWLKPILALAAIIMKATGTYQEGYVGLKSGYFWSGIAYNISITLSLYSLGMFWICMSRDLQPFRPVPKFLCVKLIIFASYWQGFFLSILVWLRVIHDVGYYTPDNIARAIQDVLICFELPGFAIAHWYAFSWKDYADSSISAARMPVYYAMRDSFGVRDLIEDSKLTFRGKGYEYRLFEPSDNVVAHPESGARVARMMEGLRYERGGKAKYWIPKPSERTGLLRSPGPSDQTREITAGQAERGENRAWKGGNYGGLEETEVDQDDERLYATARTLEYGDYNYPVITANEPYAHHRCTHNPSQRGPITTATNQALLRPKLNTRSNNSSTSNLLKSKPPSRPASSSSKQGGKNQTLRNKSPAAALSPLLSRTSSASTSSSESSHRSGIVDLVVEDTAAEETERVRARKEGGPGWNGVEPKRFIRQYPPENAGEEIREGFELPIDLERDVAPETKFTVADNDDEEDEVQQQQQQQQVEAEAENAEGEEESEANINVDDFGEDTTAHWGASTSEDDRTGSRGHRQHTSYGSLNERNIWG